ncbi:MAG: hypothetical protein HEQ39_04550 [Rhizobacter sp.]
MRGLFSYGRRQESLRHDSNDDMALALALATQMVLIASGDNDLLVLHTFEGIPALSPVTAPTFIGSA